jgi:hypothetical protein
LSTVLGSLLTASLVVQLAEVRGLPGDGAAEALTTRLAASIEQHTGQPTSVAPGRCRSKTRAECLAVLELEATHGVLISVFAGPTKLRIFVERASNVHAEIDLPLNLEGSTDALGALARRLFPPEQADESEVLEQPRVKSTEIPSERESFSYDTPGGAPADVGDPVSNLAPWAVIAVGVALASSAIILQQSSAGARAEILARPHSNDELDELRDRWHTHGTAAWVLVAFSGASIATGALLFGID